MLSIVALMADALDALSGSHHDAASLAVALRKLQQACRGMPDSIQATENRITTLLRDLDMSTAGDMGAVWKAFLWPHSQLVDQFHANLSKPLCPQDASIPVSTVANLRHSLTCSAHRCSEHYLEASQGFMLVHN